MAKDFPIKTKKKKNARWRNNRVEMLMEMLRKISSKVVSYVHQLEKKISLMSNKHENTLNKLQKLSFCV